MAMSRRGPRGGPTPRSGARVGVDGARVVTPAPASPGAADRTRQMMAPSGRSSGNVRLFGERLNAEFFREAWSELRKVHWPTPQQARNLTGLVIGVAFGVGMILGGMDYVYARIFEFILRLG
jgi:preprotein translocase subunit SecE